MSEVLYRVWCVINPPNSGIHYRVSSPEEGALLIHAWAYTHLHMSHVESNAFGLEYMIPGSVTEGTWSEWYNEEGDDIHEAFEVAMYVAD